MLEGLPYHDTFLSLDEGGWIHVKTDVATAYIQGGDAEEVMLYTSEPQEMQNAAIRPGEGEEEDMIMKIVKKDGQKEKARRDEERVIEEQLIKAKFLRAVEVPVPEEDEEAQRELMPLLLVEKKSVGCVSRVWPGNDLYQA